MSTQPIVTKDTEDNHTSDESEGPTVFELASSIQQSLQELSRKINEDDTQFNKSIESIYDKLKKIEE